MNTDRFTLTVDEYLAEKNVLFYLEDAVNQLLEHKEEYIHFGIVRNFAEYFSSVKSGNHILFREFGYVKATPHNRASFIHIFWRCFRQLGKNGDLLAMVDYSSLLQLLCPDFPVEIVQKAARIVLMDDAMDCPMSFTDFLYAFQIQFYFEEFLESVSMIYQDLLSGKSPNTVIVPTSASLEQLPSSSLTRLKHRRAWTPLFCTCMEVLCERYKYNHPSTCVIKEILQHTQRMSFYVFLMALAKHESITQDIGSLPNKTALLIDPGMDQELDKLIAQISVGPASNSSSSGGPGQKELARRASSRKSLHQRKRIEIESGSNEETDSSEN